MSFQVWCFGMNFPNLTRKKKEIGPWKTQILPSSNMSSETEWLHFILIAQRYMDTRECKDSATVQHVFLINWRCFKIIALTQRHLILLNAGCLASQVSLPLLLAAQEARCEWSILFVCVCVFRMWRTPAANSLDYMRLIHQSSSCSWLSCSVCQYGINTASKL